MTKTRYTLERARMPKGNMGGWQERHLTAVRVPTAVEASIVRMLRAWLDYANQHFARYESGIGADGVLGKEWAAIGAAVRGLLNGETGRLDCGTLDGLICDTLTAEGFDPDAL